PPRRTFSFPNQDFQPLAFFSAQPHNIYLHRLLACRHSPLRRSNRDGSESSNPFELVEAGDRLTTVGLDIAKSAFQVRGLGAAGQVVAGSGASLRSFFLSRSSS